MASTPPSTFGLKKLPPALTEFVILPEVMLAMAYAVVARIWNIWSILTLRFPTLEESDPPRMLSGTQLVIFTGVHIAFLALFIMAGRRVRRSSPSLRRGHYASLAIGVAIIVLLQVAAVRAFWLHVSAAATL